MEKKIKTYNDNLKKLLSALKLIESLDNKDFSLKKSNLLLEITDNIRIMETKINNLQNF